MDPYGNTVKVVQRIALNGTLVNQYFFETICVNDIVFEEDEIFGTTYRRTEEGQSTECKGIDKTVGHARGGH